MTEGENSDRARTSYVVLRKADPPGGWLELGRVTAHNAAAATVKAARDHLSSDELDRGVEFRAVSARSWDSGHAHLKAKHETRIVTT